MTHPGDMPDNPGDPDATDEANYSPDEAEAAAAEAAAADAEPDLDVPLDEPDELDAELSDLLDDEAAEAKIEDAEEEPLSDSEQKIAELTDDLQRLGAEYTNYRRRTERERQGVIDSSKATVVAQLLPILDDLDMAAQHGDLDAGPLKAFADKFRSTLTGLGLERFGETGEEFNPDIHEAIQDVSSGEDKALGTVLRPGYRFKDSVVRTAMVIIDDPVEDKE